MTKNQICILMQAAVIGVMFGFWQGNIFAGAFAFSAALFMDTLFGE